MKTFLLSAILLGLSACAGEAKTDEGSKKPVVINPDLRGYTLDDNSYIRCKKSKATPCGIELSDCETGKKYTCQVNVSEEELKD